MTEPDATFPAPGSPVPGAPPPLRRHGGTQVEEPPRNAVPEAAPAAAGTSVVTAPASAAWDLGAARLVAALVGTATGLWLERRWRR